MNAFQSFQTNEAWTKRLEVYADVPRRQIDLVERLLHTVAEPCVVSRELEGPPGWSVRKTGKAGRLFLTVEDMLRTPVEDLDDQIRRHFARAAADIDLEEDWARRVYEYACFPLRLTNEAEERLKQAVALRPGRTITRTPQGEPGWLIETRPLYWKVFISVASLECASVDMILDDLDRIDCGPRRMFRSDDAVMGHGS